jgi:hypothetical protein
MGEFADSKRNDVALVAGAGAGAGADLGARALHALMDRLARSKDDEESALLILLVLRTFALERGDGLLVELCPQATGMLLTLEEPASGLWHAELIPLSMATLRRVLADMPELLLPFDHRTDHEGTLRMHAKALPPQSGRGYAPRMTPVALPSLDLLVDAGLLSSSFARRGDVR